MKSFAILALLCFAVVSAQSSVACSLAGCAGDGVELRSNAIVSVVHGGKPLSGVAVQITRGGVQVFSGITEADGAVHISGLQPGDYWLNAELLGISAAYTCFHINARASRKAQKKLIFDWGGEPLAIRRITGRLQISELGKEGDLVWRVQHRIDVPIRNANLIVRSPFNDDVYKGASDQDGKFSFPEIPPGIYVLHVEGGATPNGEAFGPDDFVLRLTPSAKSENLVLKPNVGGGSCGGWAIEPN